MGEESHLSGWRGNFFHLDLWRRLEGRRQKGRKMVNFPRVREKDPKVEILHHDSSIGLGFVSYIYHISVVTSYGTVARSIVLRTREGKIRCTVSTAS